MNPADRAGPHPLRLFFALWPSQAHRQALARAAGAVTSQVEGHAVPAANLHVTLAFLGSVPGRAVGPLAELGGQVGTSATELEFDRLEYWHKPRVLVVLATRIPAEGIALVDRLWQRLEPLGFGREQRPWQPHLTLVRRVRHPPPETLAFEPLSAPPAGEPAWSLALVESTSHPEGARYRPLADWPLE